MTLHTERIRTLDAIRAFLDGTEAADITPHNREAAYRFIERTLVRFRYHFGHELSDPPPRTSLGHPPEMYDFRRPQLSNLGWPPTARSRKASSFPRLSFLREATDPSAFAPCT